MAGGWGGRGGCDSRAGATLIELLVVLVILGFTTGLSLLALPALRPSPEGEEIERAVRVRAQAIRSGQEVVATFDAATVRFLPDGRVVGGPFDPLTGVWRHAQ